MMFSMFMETCETIILPLGRKSVYYLLRDLLLAVLLGFSGFLTSKDDPFA